MSSLISCYANDNDSQLSDAAPDSLDELICTISQLVKYDKETGQFHWVVTSRRGMKSPYGKIAGSRGASHGYLSITLHGRKYLAHRLAWLLTYRELPNYIDHANRDKLDNRIQNLRKCTMSQNIANSKKSRANTSGFKGVSWSSEMRKWEAALNHSSRRKVLGYFDTAQEAANVRDEKARELFGEFYHDAR